MAIYFLVTVGRTEYRKTAVEGIDVFSLTNILQILHHRVGSTPRSISFQSLRDIAVLCDQYDFANALSPWPQFWVEGLTTHSTQHLEIGYEDWLFIATVFRETPICKKIILDVSKQLICDLVVSTPSGSKEDVNIQYSRPGKISLVCRQINLDLAPEIILAFIRKERENLLSKALHPLWSFTQSMMKLSHHHPNNDIAAYCMNSDCFALALGSLLVSIRNGVLQDTLMAKQFKIPNNLSLQAAVTAIEKLRITTLILERNSTSRVDYQDKYPTHNQSTAATPGRIKNLVKDLPDELFLRNQYESTINHTKGRYETCPLARHLASQQKAATAVLEGVVGYPI
ncbi:uncharacterized protein DFL_002130 [Arthrobotrys flagrans]|uniref:Uncharacterized protein n=1 Tax=Arthrobotrys flagrans TaxID=97331 RepID=A0A437AAN9_ARTFL|nr:hypothetical protein DFL_002130 [Arthrobotrys flagrans]